MDSLKNYEGEITHPGILEEIAVRIRDHSNIGFFVGTINKAIKAAIRVPLEYQKLDVSVFISQGPPTASVMIDIHLHWMHKNQDTTPLVATLSFVDNVLVQTSFNTVRQIEVDLPIGETTIKWLEGAHDPFSIDELEDQPMEMERLQAMAESMFDAPTPVFVNDTQKIEHPMMKDFEIPGSHFGNEEAKQPAPIVIDDSPELELVDFIEQDGQLALIFRMPSGKINPDGSPVPDSVFKKVYGAIDGRVELIRKETGRHVPMQLIPERFEFSS
jgi:hypothetical protein